MANNQASTASQGLYRLVYHSHNHIPGTASEIAGEIDAILAASQRNNMRLSVTGALIFNSGVFAQVLEGARPDVEATFERIQRDARHGKAQVLAFEPTPDRSFPSWSMAFIGRSHSGRQLFGYISKATGFDGKRLEGERIFSIMQSIALEENSPERPD
jgi:hypothetical protein